MLKFLLINFDWDIACWIYSHVVVNNKKIPSLFLKAMLYHKKEYYMKIHKMDYMLFANDSKGVLNSL